MARHARSRLILLALGAAWAAAAFFLWRTRVPAGLALPHVDAESLFTPRELERARDYERFGRWNFVLSQAAVLSVFALYARYGHRFMQESAAGRIGTGMLLAMLGLAILWLVQLPFGLADLWWQRRHHVSRLGYGDWIVDNWLGLGGEFLFICLAILIVMGLAGVFRNSWWIPGGAVFVALATLFAFVLPYLIPSQKPLEDPALRGEADRLAREQGLDESPPIRVQAVRAVTTAPNAEAAGLGPSRRIILWDTLLDGRFADDEIRFVVAHELAHISRSHVWKSVAWYALFAFPGAFVIARATRRRGGMREPEAVPVSLLVLVVLSFLALPVQNVVIRHLEAEADWVALESAGDPQAARSLFHRFSTAALADPSPPTWSYVLMQSHPTIVQRIEMARAWEERNAAR